MGFGLLSPMNLFFDEERDVSATRHDEANGFVRAVTGEILFKSLPQEARVVANNIIFAGVVSAGPSKDLFADLLLGDLVGLIEQILFADIENKTGKEFGFCKSLARGYTPGDLPSLVFFQDCELIGGSGS